MCMLYASRSTYLSQKSSVTPNSNRILKWTTLRLQQKNDKQNEVDFIHRELTQTLNFANSHFCSDFNDMAT